MAWERGIFKDVGPLHLSAVDWSNSSHRSSVAACLVQGAYNLERDRHCGGGAPDSSWWEFFGFQLRQVLVDQEDQTIFGAIYDLEFSPHISSKQHHLPSGGGGGGSPPKHVIAFRGTLTKSDLRLDVQCIDNTLHNSSRAHVGFQAVQAVVSMAGAKDVWLAGHSLGSAIALLVGRNMVLKMGHHLETYLFNPPFVSLPVHIIKNEKLRHGLRLAHTVVKAGMAVAMSTVVHNKKIAEDDEAFTLLFPWIPYLFINPSDPICAEYLDYFKDRETTVAAGAGEIGRFAARNSVRSMIMSASGKDSEPSHLIPSAYLTINLNHSPDLVAAHKLSQWWRPDLKLDYKLYQFR
ncbi:PREDICTED: GDSL esterase/lipase At4g10955-like [Ipomoea nil]|uniref:GDSL esterase/lipase At4g10955-like n=1 Tax=Ipomoea nil TaxID=35883 RepID=UPI000901EB41|nr:PREDICTED: GDSL esterase/lipase At4g10955-like [Ipomoea nil]XP_019200447.1 PREDICTED: GDSL esterase/lipase At4g10955-like [Ipomoea nil]